MNHDYKLIMEGKTDCVSVKIDGNVAVFYYVYRKDLKG